MARKAQNLRSGIPLIGGSLVEDLNSLGETISPISGSLIEDLNELGKAIGKPDIGSRLLDQVNQRFKKVNTRKNLGSRLATSINRRFNQVNGRADALSGLKGSVVIAPQKRIAGRGAPEAAIKMSGGRMGELDRALNDDEAPNWGQVKGLFSCKRFGGHVDGFLGWFRDCVQSEQEQGAAGGVLPWFWGWTVQHPHESDTLMAIFSATVESGVGLEAGQGWFWLTPFPLQESAGFTNVGFWIDTSYTPTTTYPGVHHMNVGLYNTNRELVWELGPYEVFSSDGVYASGVGRVAIDTTATSLESGEYYLALFLPSCLRLLCVDIDQNMTSLFVTPIENHMSQYPLDDPFEPNFPETVPDDPFDIGDALQLIPLFLFTNMGTIGFTG